jgi:hypothetical protein
MNTLLTQQLLFATFLWVGNLSAQAQPASLPIKALRDAPTRNLSPYWTVAGYAAINAGLFYGVHALHAATDIEEEPGHARFDSAIADSLVLTGLTSLGIGYVLRQRGAGEEILVPRLFWGTASLSSASTLLLYSLAFALRDSHPKISARSTFAGTLSLSFAVGSLTTALALRRAH